MTARRLLPLLALLAAPAAAASRTSDQPVDIQSDRQELLDRENRVIFTGRVHVVQGEMVMDTQRMTATYRKVKNGDPELQRIDASGGVTVVEPDQRAKGEFGIYDLDRRVITLIGHVTLTRGDNVVNGTRLVMDLDSGRSTVDGSAVGAAGGANPGAGGRVTGHFAVPKRQAAPSPAAAPSTAPPPPAPK